MRISTNIRITDLKVIEQNNGAYETYSSEYNKDSLSIYVTLPNIDSSILYEVTIYNSSDVDYDLSNIFLLTDDNLDIVYESDSSIGDIVGANSEKKYTIKIYYKISTLSEDVTDTLILKYEFVEHINPYIVNEYNEAKNYEFVAPYSGIYKLELWGSGGEDYECVYSETIGKGAYTSGMIELLENQVLYFYIGGVESFNGGGPGEAGGGGSTDVRLISGEWDNFESLKSRIMVAAGGGGGAIKYWSGYDYYYEGDSPGDAGGLNGYDAYYRIVNINNNTYGYSGYGASQVSGGKPGKASGYYELTEEATGHFGVGGYINAFVNGLTIFNHSSGGGSGYYGGGHGVHTSNAWTGAGGGSSYISGHEGCDAILESSTEKNIIHTGQSVHYSGYKFTNTIMIDGRGYNWTSIKGDYVGMPTFDGNDTMVGNKNIGHAKITFIERTY